MTGTFWVLILNIYTFVSANGKRCAEGWQLHEGTCYYFSGKPASWTRAQAACVSLGQELGRQANLAIISRMDIQNFICDIVRITDEYYWIGLNRSSIEDPDWTWVDGSKISFQHWDGPEPNNLDTELCVHIYSWKDWRCTWNNNICNRVNYGEYPLSKRLHYICEVPATKDQVSTEVVSTKVEVTTEDKVSTDVEVSTEVDVSGKVEAVTAENEKPSTSVPGETGGSGEEDSGLNSTHILLIGLAAGVMLSVIVGLVVCWAISRARGRQCKDHGDLDQAMDALSQANSVQPAASGDGAGERESRIYDEVQDTEDADAYYLPLAPPPPGPPGKLRKAGHKHTGTDQSPLERAAVAQPTQVGTNPSPGRELPPAPPTSHIYANCPIKPNV